MGGGKLIIIIIIIIIIIVEFRGCMYIFLGISNVLLGHFRE